MVDAVYESKLPASTVDTDPLPSLLGVGALGGFRKATSNGRVLFCALVSSLVDLDWPDELDELSGVFTYYGDNRRPGKPLHDTPLGGNRMLRDWFDALHDGRREEIPPLFVFTNGPKGRDKVFRGLVVPGVAGMSADRDLVAVWRKGRKGARK